MSIEDKSVWDAVAWIIDYECGQLRFEEVLDGFQRLLDSGLVWQLQGSYGRTAVDLIRGGYLTAPDDLDLDEL